MRYRLFVFILIPFALVGVTRAESKSKKHSIATVVPLENESIEHRSLPNLRHVDVETVHRSLPSEIAKKLDQCLEAGYAKSKVTGVSAALLIEGQGIWRGVYGVQDRETGEELTASSRIHAGSIGKLFTAAMLLQLVEDGNVRLDEPIHRWFPRFPNADEISIDQLLTHTSGIFSFNWSADVQESSRYLPADRLLRIAEREGMLFPPGTHWSYSNTNYLMLGMIIASERHCTYEEALGAFIKQCGLSNARVITPSNQNEILIAGYHGGRDARQITNLAVPHAAGLVACDPGDLVLFFRKLLGGEILSPEAANWMVSDLYPMGSGVSHWGRGLMLLKMPMGEVFYLAGRIKGYGAVLAYCPAKKATVAIMVNDETQVDPFIYLVLKALP